METSSNPGGPYAHSGVMTNSNANINPETGTKYSRAELKAAFDAVCDKSNWKMPIDSTIDKSDEDVTREAVIFFAGCAPSFSIATRSGRGRRLRVRAVGYYQAVGA